MTAKELVSTQRKRILSGELRHIRSRKEALKTLLAGIEDHEESLMEALKNDLSKDPFEAYSNEIGLVKAEIRQSLRHLRRWAKTKHPIPEMHLLPGRATITREAFGSVLVISPWNYPIQLALLPVVAALAGGNAVVLKPSEVSTASEQALKTLISETFPDGLVMVRTGGVSETTELLEAGFDMIFFTGSPAVGRIVMAKAAETLTPVVLELGGKSPVIVAADADIPQAARQIALGKFNNAGQTCVAPDYVLVERSAKEKLVEELQKTILTFYGNSPSNSQEYGRLIHEKHTLRLASFIEGQTILHGGEYEVADRYMAPTLLDDPPWNSPVMMEEIFGPILPILTYDEDREVLDRVNSRPNPLALYLFTKNRAFEKTILENLAFGSGMVNGTLLQVASHRLPFGGTRESGIGQYHGKAGFDVFTRPRSVLKRRTRPDLPLAYPRSRVSLGLVRKLLP